MNQEAKNILEKVFAKEGFLLQESTLNQLILDQLMFCHPEKGQIKVDVEYDMVILSSVYSLMPPYLVKYKISSKSVTVKKHVLELLQRHIETYEKEKACLDVISNLTVKVNLANKELSKIIGDNVIKIKILNYPFAWVELMPTVFVDVKATLQISDWLKASEIIKKHFI